MVETQDKYWQEYTNHQRVKHELIRRYLGGWYPKLGTWAGKVLYFDTHAGRGRHASGEAGSPLVALETLLTHSGERLLRGSQFRFYFMEQNQENVAALDAELEELELPRNVTVTTVNEDCFQYLSEVADHLRQGNKRMAPAFIFVDPFSFMVPFSLLREVMDLGRVELFVNVIWRELDMALSHGRKATTGKWVDNLTTIFGSEAWRDIDADTSEGRADQALDLLSSLINARWVTPVKMMTGARTSYMLVHFTNHDAGRDLMKDCMWAACEVSEFGFQARKDGQQFLLGPRADFEPVRRLVLDSLPARWSQLHDLVRPEIWRQTHVNDAVRALRKSGELTAEPGSYKGNFAPKNDPRLVAGE